MSLLSFLASKSTTISTLISRSSYSFINPYPDKRLVVIVGKFPHGIFETELSSVGVDTGIARQTAKPKNHFGGSSSLTSVWSYGIIPPWRTTECLRRCAAESHHVVSLSWRHQTVPLVAQSVIVHCGYHDVIQTI